MNKYLRRALALNAVALTALWGGAYLTGPMVRSDWFLFPTVVTCVVVGMFSAGMGLAHLVAWLDT